MYLIYQLEYYNTNLWNSANSAIMGFSMSSDEFSSLHDIYEDLEEDEHSQKTTYVIQFYGGTFHQILTSLDPTSPFRLPWKQSFYMALL